MPARTASCFGVGENELDAVGEAGRGDVRARQREHAFGGVDGGDVNAAARRQSSIGIWAVPAPRSRIVNESATGR